MPPEAGASLGRHDGAGGDSAAKLAVDRATKFYDARSGPLHALDNYSMDVNDGEFVCVVGPSGCGKTTLLWAMAGLHSLTNGEVRLDGALVDGPHPEIGMVFQEANLLPWRTLTKNIHLPFEIKGTRPDQPWIDHLLERVGLDGFGGKYPARASRAACSSGHRSCGHFRSTLPCC